MPKVKQTKLREDFKGDHTSYEIAIPKEFAENNLDLVGEDFKPKRTFRGNIKLIRVK